MIKPNFTLKEFSNVLKERVRKIEEAILTNLKFIGEKFVVNARSEDTYKDQTGNLRSSIGYIIYKNGKRVYSGFPGSNDTGRFKGIQVAEDVAVSFQKAICVLS